MRRTLVYVDGACVAIMLDRSALVMTFRCQCGQQCFIPWVEHAGQERCEQCWLLAAAQKELRLRRVPPPLNAIVWSRVRSWTWSRTHRYRKFFLVQVLHQGGDFQRLWAGRFYMLLDAGLRSRSLPCHVGETITDTLSDAILVFL